MEPLPPADLESPPDQPLRGTGPYGLFAREHPMLARCDPRDAPIHITVYANLVVQQPIS
jgi:hypothetical protein